MADKVKKWENDGRVAYMFYCLGCKCHHSVYTAGDGVPNWGFNESLESPTFAPSILVTYPHMSKEGGQKYMEFKEANGRYPTKEEMPYDANNICHSYVTSGNIQYLGDSTHEYAGQTIELPDYEEATVQ